MKIALIIIAICQIIKIIQAYTEKCRNAHKMAIEALEQENSGGCCGCAFEDVEEWEMPCSKCKRGCNDYWRPKKKN